MQQLEIDRTKWYRGNKYLDSRLLSARGMCCLGFYALACGLEEVEILNKSYPNADDKRNPEWLFESYLDRNFNEILAQINDSSLTSDAEKEKKITRIFAEHGVEVTFVN